MVGEAIRMVGSREISERVSRCIAMMVYYRAEGESRDGARDVEEETRSLVAWACSSNVRESLDESVLMPMEVGLSDRYGPDEGHRLYGEFLRALRCAFEQAAQVAESAA